MIYAHARSVVRQPLGRWKSVMASSSEGGVAFCYEEAPCFYDVSVSRSPSKATRSSFSRVVEARRGGALPTRVRLRWSEPHCPKRRRSSRRRELVFARVSVSQSVGSWPVGEFVEESNRRLHQIFRSVRSHNILHLWAYAMKLLFVKQLVFLSSLIRLLPCEY